MTTNTIVYEAEDLVLNDFQIVNGTQASGGQLIKICGSDATASTDFNHGSAYYDVTIWVQDENDGHSTIELVVDGLVVGTIVLNQDDDGAGSDNGGFSAFTLDNILVEQGANVELRAVRDNGEWVRIDKIAFDKVGDFGGASSAPIVFEAEDFALTGFHVASGSQASGGEMIKLGGAEGTASTSFTGESGVYHVGFWIQDECDGQSTVELVVDGAVVGTIVLDRDNNGGGSDNSGFSTFSLAGITVNAGSQIELRAQRDDGEWVRIDKLEFTRTGDAVDCPVETLMTETFDGSGLLTNSANVESSHFYRQNNTATTDGCYDGTLKFRAVDLTDYENATISFDAKIVAGSFEAWGFSGGDRIRIQLVDQDGTVHLLDQFTGWGQTLTGSVTGQTIGAGNFAGLTYEIPAGFESAQLRIVSNISAAGEKVAFDNVEITATKICEPGDTGGDPVVIVLDAVDDSFVVGETEDIAANILDNDTTNSAQALSVAEVVSGGSAVTLGEAFTVTTEGGRTGSVTVNADGTFTFDGGDNFTDLIDGQTDSFQLSYTIRVPAEEQVKHNLLFVLDISNSTVNGNGTQQDVFVGTGVGDVNGDGVADTVLDAQIAGVIAAVQNLLDKGADPSKIDIGIVTFSGVASGYTTINAETLGTFALDSAGLINALTGIDSGGWTNYEAGLKQARDWFAGQQGDGAVNKMYFLSDGRPIVGFQNGQYIYQGMAQYGDEIGSIVNTYGAEVHAIGVGANSDLAYLNHLDNTGGAEQVLDTTSLTALLEETTSVLVEDTATVTVVINGEGQIVDALDNAYSVGETEDIAANIIADDLLNGAAAAPGALVLTDIAVVDGATQTAQTVGESFTVTTAGGRTGTVTVNADGSFSFDGGDSFTGLNAGETDSFRLAYTVSAETETTVSRTADFDGPDLAAGTIVSNQIEGVTISAVRKGMTGENAAMIFDADNPTGGDFDLFQAGEGGVLIITEDFDSLDPDDNAGGGTFTFTFDDPSTVQAMSFLDTEEPTPVLKFYDEGGVLIAQMNGPTTADGGMADMTIGLAGVKTMTVELKGSGAIAGLTFDTTTTTVGASDTAFVDVVINGEGVADLLPVAADDLLVTDEATSAAVNLLANDTAGDGATAIVAIDGGAADGTPFTLTSTDGRTATFTLQPDGTLTVDPGADFLTLARDEVREFTLSYTIEDADGDQSSATVTVAVNGLNEGPVAEDDAATADEDAAAVTGNVLANDSDPNGDAIAVVSAGGVAAGTAIAVSGTSTKGTALEGTLTVNADGSYSFVPGAGYGAMDQDETVTFTVAYVIEDVHGASATADLTITIEGLNEPPVAVDDVAAADEDVAAVTGNVLANDSDPNGDAITIVDAGGQPAGAALALAATTSLGRPVTATLTIGADGGYSLVPGAGMAAMAEGETVAFAVGYTIEDVWGDQASATLTVTLNGLNEPPVAVNDQNRTNENVSAVLGNVLANDGDPNDDAYATDSISVISAGGVAAGTAIPVTATSAQGIVLAGSLTVAANGAYELTPGSGFGSMGRFDSAEFVIEYTIEDSNGAIDTAQLKIIIDGVNDTPVAVDNDYDVAEAGSLAGNILTDDTGDGVDSDPNGDDIFVVQVKQAGTSLGSMGDSWTVTSDNGRTGTLTVSSDGSFIFTPGPDFEALGSGEKDTVRMTYVIEDEHGSQSIADFAIDVMGEDGGGGGGGGAPTINVAFVVDVSASMFGNEMTQLPVGDLNNDGVANSKFDLAYYILSNAIADLEAAAATAGFELKVGLIGFDDEAIDAVNWSGTGSLEAWGAGNGLVFQQGTAGDSDIDVGLAEAAGWFSDIGADGADDNQVVVLSDGQFSAPNAAGIIASWQAQFLGDVHARFVGTLDEIVGPNFGAIVSALSAANSGSVTPNDPEFYAYDLASAELAVQPETILSFV